MADEDSVSSYSTAGSEDIEKTHSPESGSSSTGWGQHSNNESNYMSSTSHISPSSGSTMVAMSRLSQNPFAIKTAAAPRSLTDISDCKESRPILTPPTLRLGSDQQCAVTSTSRILLRPSALSAQTEKLKFIGSQKTDPKQEDKENKMLEASGDSSEHVNETSSKKSDSKHLFVLADSSSKEEASPLKASVTASETPAPSGFVFGQNLHERVVVSSLFSSNYEQESVKADSSSTVNLSFQEAASKSESESSQDGISSRSAKSLSESAEEIQSRQVKRKFSEVTVITGEEEESNVLQMNCKLFAFDNATSSWQERGRGILRLNDREVFNVLHSRVVMRTQGSLRVVLNTKVWSGMSVEHPSPKTVRITAVDTDGVRVFLIMANPKDAEQLFNALDWRVATLKSQEESRGKMNNGISNYHDLPTQDTLSSAQLPTSDSEDYPPKRRCSEHQPSGADSTTACDECSPSDKCSTTRVSPTWQDRQEKEEG